MVQVLFVVTDPFTSYLDYLLSEHDVMELQEEPQKECETVQVIRVCVCVCLCVCVFVCVCVCVAGNNITQRCTPSYSLPSH